MNIKITGSSGYLGTIISNKLKEHNHHVEGIQRDLLYGPAGKLKQVIKDTDIIINLAGAPILQRWTEKNKKIIYKSRIDTTANLIAAIKDLDEKNRPDKFITASAIGIYEPGKKHDEKSSDYAKGFVGNVVEDWENASNEIPKQTKRIVFRIAPVLGKKSETIKKMRLPFKLGLGGTIGKGEQAFPFIHEEDVSIAFLWAVEECKNSGIFNLSAPETISNKTFTKTFAGVLNRPAVLRIPGFALKLVYGAAAKTLLKSPAVEPRQLQEAGFRFNFPTIEETLTNILK